MEINSIEYNDKSIKYLKQKIILYFVFLVLFSALFVTSVTLLVLLITNNIKEFLSYIVVIFQMLGNGLYVFTCIATILQTKKLFNRINAEGSFTVPVNPSIKVNYNKKITTMALVYLICAVVLLIATIGSIVMLCLTFSITMLAEVLFMVLILCFAVLITISTTIEDTRIKVTLVTSKANINESETDNNKKDTTN